MGVIVSIKMTPKQAGAMYIKLGEAEDRIIVLEDKIKKLEFMVENGLGYEDLQRDA